MKCQILFSGKNKKNSINLSSAENAQRVVKVKDMVLFFFNQKSFIAPDKMFFQLKSTDIFLISPQKCMLWVLIRSTSVRHF